MRSNPRDTKYLRRARPICSEFLANLVAASQTNDAE